MNELQIFNNEEFGTVRGLRINDEPWVVGKDVASALGYENATKAVRDHVDEDDRIMGVQNVTPSFIDSMGRSQYPTLINESGVYALIFTSRLPAAKRFKHWVTSEVLPSIRKNGVYATEDFINHSITDPEWAIRLLTEIKEQREENRRLGEEIVARQQMIETMTPKVNYYDKILSSPGTMTPTQIAKDYGMSPQEFNTVLHDLGIQYKVGKQWVLYQQFANYGYTDTQTRLNKMGYSYVQTKWTQKGRLFLYDKLKAAGLLPLIEREAA